MARTSSGGRVTGKASGRRPPLTRGRKAASEKRANASAANGREAILKNTELRPDVITMDIEMPVMDGIALALKAAKDYPELRILMMTGFDAEKARAHNLHFLVHDVLSKPFTLDQLTQTVARVLAAPPATDPT